MTTMSAETHEPRFVNVDSESNQSVVVASSVPILSIGHGKRWDEFSVLQNSPTARYCLFGNSRSRLHHQFIDENAASYPAEPVEGMRPYQLSLGDRKLFIVRSLLQHL